MDNMITFSGVILTQLADFLLQPPVFYIVGLVCFCFVVKAVKIIIH